MEALGRNKIDILSIKKGRKKNSAKRIGTHQSKKLKYSLNNLMVESDNLTFADGYSINAISYDETSQILALSAGDDGVIIYSWNGYLSVSLRGIIDTGEHNKVYDVKVVGDNIYVGSENGISIYKIEG